MQPPKVDLRTAEMRPEPKRVSRFVVFFIVLFLSISAAALSTNIIFSEHPIVEWGSTTFLGQLRSLVQSGERKLQGEHTDRINILFLGIGGAGHDGPNLTDTIILASYQPSTGKVALLSIPRDLTVTSPEFGSVKINAVNAYAEQRERGSGGNVTAQTLSVILDQPITYWVRIDFRGFERVIDAVGGVDVNVDRAFTDERFPVGDGTNTLRTVSFRAGIQHMDGKTALDFARSRHGGNGEGSDFARSKRQEKVLVAVREKLLRAGTLLNPFTIDQLIATVKNSLATNFMSWEVLRLARTASGIQGSDIHTRVMSDANVLMNGTTAEGAFILMPKDGNWQLVRDYARDVFTEPVAPVKTEIRVEVQNGTTITGLGQKTSSSLTSNGFTVVRVGNATDRDFEKSVIYDFTQGGKPDALTKLRSIVNANVAPAIPASLTTVTGESPTDIDFILVLGKNASL